MLPGLHFSGLIGVGLASLAAGCMKRQMGVLVLLWSAIGLASAPTGWCLSIRYRSLQQLMTSLIVISIRGSSSLSTLFFLGSVLVPGRSPSSMYLYF